MTLPTYRLTDRRSQRTLSLFSGRPTATTGCLEHGPIIQHHGMRSRQLEIEKFCSSPDFRCLPIGVTRKSELFPPEAELPRSARKFSPFWLAFLLISTILSTVFTYRTGGSSSTHEHREETRPHGGTFGSSRLSRGPWLPTRALLQKCKPPVARRHQALLAAR